jgi:hypothetical protein
MGLMGLENEKEGIEGGKAKEFRDESKRRRTWK